MPSIKVGLPGIASVSFSDEEVRAFFQRDTAVMLGGPCLLLSRLGTQALDAPREHPDKVGLWRPHGLPWQQWRLRDAGSEHVWIESVYHQKRRLAAPRDGHRSVRLMSARSTSDQRWRLTRTEDQAAFLIQSQSRPGALDATLDPTDGTTPIIWEDPHWQPQQQWMVVRLPLT